jgi:4-amino-4-deoxy-L-arabinose transferase-like glycosyltransferase
MGSQIESATLERVFSPSLHRRPPWFYLGVLFGDGFAPWSFLAAAACWVLWRERRARLADAAALRPIVAWGIGSFLFFSMIPGKREQYMLPLLPAFALAAGWLVAARLWERPVAAWARRAMAAMAGLGVTVCFAAASLALMRHPLLARVEFEPTWPRALALAAAGVLMIGLALYCARPARWPHAVAAWAAGLAIGSLAVYGAILPGLNGSKSTRALAEAADAALAQRGAGAEAVVGAMGRTYRPQYQVYGHYMLVELPDKAGALREWLQGHTPPPVIVGETGDFEDVAAALDPLGYRVIYESGQRLGPLQARARGGE